MKRKLNKIAKEDLEFHRRKTKLLFLTALKSSFIKLKKKYGITQRDIAKALGVHPSAVSKKLNGEVNLTLDSISDLARAMEIKIIPNLKSWEEILEEERKKSDLKIIHIFPNLELISEEATQGLFPVKASTKGYSFEIEPQKEKKSLIAGVAIAQGSLEDFYIEPRYRGEDLTKYQVDEI